MSEPRDIRVEKPLPTYPSAEAIIEAIDQQLLKERSEVIIQSELTVDDLQLFLTRLGSRESGLHRQIGESTVKFVVGGTAKIQRPHSADHQSAYFLHTHPDSKRGIMSADDLAVQGPSRELLADHDSVFEYTNTAGQDDYQSTDPFTGSPIQDVKEFKDRYFRFHGITDEVKTNDPEYKRVLELCGVVRNRVEYWDEEGMQRFMDFINGKTEDYTSTTTEEKHQHNFDSIITTSIEACAAEVLSNYLVATISLDFPLIRLRRLTDYKQLFMTVPIEDLRGLTQTLHETLDVVLRQTVMIDFCNEHQLRIPGILGMDLTADDIADESQINTSYLDAQHTNDYGDQTDKFTLSGKDLKDSLMRHAISVRCQDESGSVFTMPIDKALMVWQATRR